jgi:hypothetical protein
MTLKNRKCYIYALYEKEKNYRYIGKSLEPEKRLKNHIFFSKFKKTYKDNWIQSVILKNGNINIEILEETDEENWSKREKYWIKTLKEKGFQLTNHNNGGLGGGPIIYKKNFSFVKKWVNKNIKVSTSREWYKYIKEKKIPDFIPKNPKEVYLKKGWTSWGDFLGTGREWDNKVNYITYEEAKKWIKNNLNSIENEESWKNNAKKKQIPYFIPNRPNRYYKNKNRGWISWGDFLSTGRIANKDKKFLNYEEAKKWIKTNVPNIKSFVDWKNQCKSNKIPIFIPKCPHLTYKNKGWLSWGDFLSK